MHFNNKTLSSIPIIKSMPCHHRQVALVTHWLSHHTSTAPGRSSRLNLVSAMGRYDVKKKPIREHRLRVLPWINVQHVLHILLEWCVRLELSGYTVFAQNSALNSWVVLFKFFSMCFVSVHVVHPYYSMDTDTAGKNSLLCIPTIKPSPMHSYDKILSRAFFFQALPSRFF